MYLNHSFCQWYDLYDFYPCNEYPLIPHFHIVKLGYAGVYLFFLHVSWRFERVPTINVLSKSKKNNKKFLLKIFNFYNFNNLCLSHVFVPIILYKQFYGY